jgi:hypothetical protein
MTYRPSQTTAVRSSSNGGGLANGISRCLRRHAYLGGSDFPLWASIPIDPF